MITEIDSEEDEKPVRVPVMMCMIMGCTCNDFKDFGRFKFANQNKQNFISLTLKGSTMPLRRYKEVNKTKSKTRKSKIKSPVVASSLCRYSH